MTMARYNLVIQDEDGNIIDGASVEIRRETVGQPLATLKPNRDGSGTLANPFTAADGADAGFFVAGGAYQVRVYTGPSGSPTFERIWRYVAIGLAGEADTFGDMYGANNGSEFANKTATKDRLSVQGSDVASASTVNLETATGDLIDITGTATITAITLGDGHERTVRAAGAFTLTNSASLVLPGGANITAAAGDFFVFRGYSGGVVRCVGYSPLIGLLKALSSSTDNAAVRMDGTGGKTVQQSALIIADTTAALSRSGNGGVPIQGTNTNDAAAAGYVGELLTAEVTYAARFALTTGTVTTILTISATAGDWDGNAMFGFETSGGGASSEYHLEISTTAPPTAITAPNAAGTGGYHVSFVANQGQGFPIGPRQFLLSGTTTCYMKCLSSFSNSQTVYGFFRLRRMR